MESPPPEALKQKIGFIGGGQMALALAKGESYKSYVRVRKTMFVWLRFFCGMRFAPRSSFLECVHK